jgi:ATP-dependent helicase HrpB
MDAPPAATLAQARDLLRRLGAIDASHAITATGRAMLATGLHPRLAHMLVRARGTPRAALAARLAALLSERESRRPRRAPR